MLGGRQHVGLPQQSAAGTITAANRGFVNQDDDIVSCDSLSVFGSEYLVIGSLCTTVGTKVLVIKKKLFVYWHCTIPWLIIEALGTS